uniref:C2H2-type domain-containing protein n=1 Tax=Macrostomum lignano TaxID=282301 RepID=A0A1I8F5H6_9PLAT
MSSAQEQEGSKRRSRLDEFLANNSGLVASSPAVTHVLCCPPMPSCCFMSLQESELVAHVATCGCVGPVDSCNVTVYSCSRCHGASTQLDLMRQHMNIYHGLSGQEEVSSQLTACQLSCRPVDFGGPALAPAQRKRKKSRAGANPVTSLCCQRENFEAFGLVGCKARRQALHPASRLACLSLRHSGSPPEAAGRRR